MTTGAVKDTKISAATPIEVLVSGELIIEAAEKDQTNEQPAVSNSKAQDRFLRFKKSLRKRSVSIF